MGRLAISRGFPSSEASEEPVRLALVEPAPPPASPLAAVHARLDALERLARLCEAGVLTIEELVVEKQAVLGHGRSAPSEPHAEGGPPVPVTAAPRGRSLLGRLGWAILPLGLASGLGLAVLTQPEAAAQAWREGLRLFGL